MKSLHFDALDLFAIPLRGVGLIEASAGTGKTWTITGLYVRLLVEESFSVEQILVVTYTKAATAELRERIRRRLGEVLASMATGQIPDDFCRNLLERAIARAQVELAIRRLQTALRNFDEAAIFTIHGFCQRVLAESAFESGVAFETELAPDESSILQEVVDDFWRRETAGAPTLWIRYLAESGETPDAWRKAVSTHLDKPYLELASTPDLAEAGEIETAFTEHFHTARALWRDSHDEITHLLLNAAGDKTLKNTSYRADTLPRWFETLDDYFRAEEPGLALPEKLARLSLAELKKGTAKNRTPPHHPFFSACSALVEAASRLQDHFHSKLIGIHIRLIRECNAELPRRKSRMGLMSYNDLLNRLAEALQASEGRQLSDAIAKRYRAALIDEFQDTDPVQYRIFRAIYGEKLQPAFFVGDPKQAIYGFRGADVFSYLQARSQASARYTLSVNQRSTPKLIAAVNTLFRRSPNPFLFRDIDYPVVQAADKSRPILIVEGDSDEPFRFVLANTTGKALSKEAANSLAALSTANEIARLLSLAKTGRARLAPLPSSQPDPAKREKIGRPITGGDIAILVPTHRQGALIQEALTARGIPAVRQGQDNVFRSSEALELERILLAVAEPRRESRVRAALATEISGFDATALFALQTDEKNWEMQLFNFARYREIWLGRGFMPMFRRWLEENGVVERLLRYSAGERRLTNLLHLAELLHVKSVEKSSPDGLLGWFSRTIRDPEADEEALLRLESDADRVKIVTIHTSKGLEYPIVFCPFLWDGNLWRRDEIAATFHDPTRGYQPVLNLGGADYDFHRHLASREKLAEKLRLLYVALTRAEHRCHVVWGAISGIETSALGWLLHGPDVAIDDPLGAMASIAGTLDHTAIEQALNELAGQAPGAFSVEPLLVDEMPYSPSTSTTENLRSRTFTRPYLRPNWRMSSFSALTRGHHSEGPDYDQVPPDPRDQPQEQTLFAFPRGANAGRCLHAIFEEWDFRSTDRGALERLVRRKLKAHAIAEQWMPVVANGILAVLAADLDGHGLKLMNIDERNRLAELEFTYPLPELGVHALKTLLCDPRQGLPDEFSQASEGLIFERVNGYMKGFIDLVFENEGRFYLLDYKSNWLGPATPDYARPQLLQAMAREHYYLQYLIYTLALHRYLSLRLPDYDYDRCFGGVFYLFLRGMCHEDSPRHGIFQDRPCRSLIEALEKYLS